MEIRVNADKNFIREGDDLHVTLTVPMTAAALGTDVTLDTFDGERELSVKPGTQAGETLTLRGLGVTHLRGYGRGDLQVHVHVETPSKLRLGTGRACSANWRRPAARNTPRASWRPRAPASSPGCVTRLGHL